MLYDCGVEYDDFRSAVLELADGGTRITKGNVALRLEVDPTSTGAMLDRMTREGQLELDIDERSGEIFYEVRRRPGERPRASAESAPLRDLQGALGTALGMAKVVGAAGMIGGGTALPPERRHSLALGVILGGLIPGIGLAYSAPWPVVAASSAVVLLGYKVLALIPVFSTLLLIPFLAVCALASAVLGGLYTWQYNQTGKRSPLGDEPLSPKQILKRLRK